MWKNISSFTQEYETTNLKQEAQLYKSKRAHPTESGFTRKKEKKEKNRQDP